MSVATARQTLPLPPWQSRGTSPRSAPSTRVSTPVHISPRRLTASPSSFRPASPITSPRYRPASPITSPRYQRSRSGSASSIDEIPPSVALLVLRRKFAHAIATRMKVDPNDSKQTPERSISRASVGTETDTEIDDLIKDYETKTSPRVGTSVGTSDRKSYLINKRAPIVEAIILKSEASSGLESATPSGFDFDEKFSDLSSSSQQSARKRALPTPSSSIRRTQGTRSPHYGLRDSVDGRKTPDSGTGSLNASLDSPGRSPRRDQGGEEKLIRTGTDLAQTKLNLHQTGQDLRALRLRIVMLQNEVSNVRDERQKMDRQLQNMTEGSLSKPLFSRRTPPPSRRTPPLSGRRIPRIHFQ